MSKEHSTVGSFAFAINGIKIAIKDEPNIRVHFIFGFIVLITGMLLRISTLEFAIIFLTIGLVIALELINTALEALVDIVSPDTHHLAKVAKDVCAAGVFTSSVTAVMVGAFIFIPRIMSALGQ